MYKAFLSSLVLENRTLREEIHDLGVRLGRPVYVDEIDKPRKLPSPAPIEVVDELFTRIDESELFICVLSGDRLGANLDLFGQVAHASYWEIELLYAALLGRPAHVFVTHDFVPTPPVEHLLGLLRPALAPASWHGPMNRRQVVDGVKRLVEESAKPAWDVQPGLPGRLLERLIQAREPTPLGGVAERSHLLFLGGALTDTTVHADLDLVRALLSGANAQPNERRRLAGLWPAIRQLMGAPFARRENEEALPLWNMVLGAWSSAAAWYGLQGHVHLGSLAALNSMVLVREKMRDPDRRSFDPADTRYPGGALGSTRYSIAKRLARSRTRNRMFEAALADVNRSLREGVADVANTLAVRGSILRQQWRLLAALDDYKRVLKLREQEDAPEGQLGEALSELGFGYLLTGRLLKGKRLLVDGVRFLEGGDSRPGFLVRARRKLAIAEALTGHPLVAREELARAARLAAEHSLRDQTRQIRGWKLSNTYKAPGGQGQSRS